jgi:hypothetical protein
MFATHTAHHHRTVQHNTKKVVSFSVFSPGVTDGLASIYIMFTPSADGSSSLSRVTAWHFEELYIKKKLGQRLLRLNSTSVIQTLVNFVENITTIHRREKQRGFLFCTFLFSLFWVLSLRPKSIFTGLTGSVFRSHFPFVREKAFLYLYKCGYTRTHRHDNVTFPAGVLSSSTDENFITAVQCWFHSQVENFVELAVVIFIKIL